MSQDMYAGRIKKDNASNEVDQYYKSWPLKSKYNDDLKYASSVAIDYLKKIEHIYKKQGITGLVIFDFDDTLVFGDPANTVGVQEMTIGQEIFILPPNNLIVKIAQVAREKGFKIIILTARPKESKLATIVNLNMFNIPYDMLIMNDADSDPQFKTKIRKQLVKEKQKIVLTIGDQLTDLYLPGANTACIKLPDPDSLCSYIYIP